MFAQDRKALLALEAVLDVALHARPEPVQARAITTRLKVPQRYLEQIMQALVRGNILRGVRGPNGGYRLARERRRITLAEIITTIDANQNNSDNNNIQSYSEIGARILKPLNKKLTTQMYTELNKITLDELCTHIENRPHQQFDFTI